MMKQAPGQKPNKGRRVRLTTVLGGMLCAVLGLLLLSNLTIILQGALHPEKPPSVLGVTPLVVLSGSMSGTREGHIETGDLIFVGTVSADELEVGDVIAYMSGGSAVTHRITAIDSGEDGTRQFTTRGDANNAEDADPVTETQLVGRYLGRLPKVGDFAFFLQQPLGMLLFIGVPLLAFVIYDILRRQHYANQERAKAQQMQAELDRLRAMTGADPDAQAPGPDTPT